MSGNDSPGCTICQYTHIDRKLELEGRTVEEGDRVVLAGCGDAEGSTGSEVNGVQGLALSHDVPN